RSHRDVHDLGDLCQGESLQIGEQERGAKLLGQFPERSLQVQRGGHRGDGGVRVGGILGALSFLVEEDRLMRVPPVERQERVSQNLKQPRPEMRSRLEAVGEAEGAEIGLLDEIVGVRGSLGEPEGEAVERVEVERGLSAGVGAHRRGGRTGWGIGRAWSALTRSSYRRMSLSRVRATYAPNGAASRTRPAWASIPCVSRRRRRGGRSVSISTAQLRYQRSRV